MTKDDIVTETALHTRMPKTKIAKTLDLLLQEVSTALEQHERVEIRRFGSFEVTFRKARVARDLNTNAEIRLPERAMPRFVPFDAFKNTVSAQYADRVDEAEEEVAPKQVEKTVAVETTAAPEVPDTSGKDEKTSLAGLEARIQTSPDNADARFELAREYERRGLFDRAMEQYQQIQRQNPNHVDAINSMGKMLFLSGAKDRAAQEYDRALNMDPNHAGTLMNRALLRTDIGRYNEAEQDFKHILEYNPEAADACFQLGVLYTKRGLYGRAIQEFEHALEIDPEAAEAYFQLGKTYDHLERHEDAIRMFEALIGLEPENARAYWHLGVLYDKTRQSHKALEMYQQSNRLSAANHEGE